MKKTTTLLFLFILTSVNAQFFEDFESGVPGKMEQVFTKGETTWINFGLSAIGVDNALADTNSAVFFNGMAVKEVTTALQTPIIDLSNSKLSLEFLYLQKLKTENYANTLTVDLSVDGGLTWKEIATFNQTANEAKFIQIELAHFNASASSIIRFKSTQTDSSAGFPIVIDDISIDNKIINTNRIDSLTNEIHKVVIYPNPSNGIVNIKTNEPIELTIFDSNGRIIFNEMKITNDINIDLSQFSKGIYFAKTNSISTQELNKIIIK